MDSTLPVSESVVSSSTPPESSSPNDNGQARCDLCEGITSAVNDHFDCSYRLYISDDLAETMVDDSTGIDCPLPETDIPVENSGETCALCEAIVMDDDDHFDCPWLCYLSEESPVDGDAPVESVDPREVSKETCLLCDAILTEGDDHFDCPWLLLLAEEPSKQITQPAISDKGKVLETTKQSQEDIEAEAQQRKESIMRIYTSGRVTKRRRSRSPQAQRWPRNPEKRVICENCGRTFANKYNLRSHRRGICGGDPKYPCPQCDYKNAPDESHLREHIRRVHENVKDFVCHICKKGFGSAGVRKSHIEVVHLRKYRYVCEMCPGHRFYEKSTLKAHMEAHDSGTSMSAYTEERWDRKFSNTSA